MKIDISRYTQSLLKAILVLMPLFVPLIGSSQVWDGKAKTKSFDDLEGSGTEADPWLIKSGADLKLLQAQTSGDKFGRDKYYKQAADIDLGGHALGLIANSSFPFKANYDGDGYTISNLMIDWSNITSVDGYGLFRFVQECCIKNMILDGVHITRTDAYKNQETPDKDIKIGILAAAVSPGAAGSDTRETTIENIIVRNSRIDDGRYPTPVVTIFVGGLIGDVTSTYGGSATLVGLKPLNISNVYVEADIDLANTVRGGKYTDGAKYMQYNVGGIVGRLRKPRIEDFPQNTYFSGKINAPYAIVGPVWGQARCNETTSDNRTLPKLVYYAAQAYAGEYFIRTSIKVLDTAANANRLFSAFKVYDNSGLEGHTEAYVNVTNNNPSTLGLFGTRTLVPTSVDLTSSSNTEYLNNSKADMAQFQGFNRGTYVSSNADALPMFNQWVQSKGDGYYEWVYDPTSKKVSFNRPSYIVLNQVDDFSYQAEVKLAPAGSYAVNWYNEEGELLFSDTRNPKSVYTATKYYDQIIACLVDDHGTVLDEEEIIPSKVKLTIKRPDFGDFAATLTDYINRDNFELRWTGVIRTEGTEVPIADTNGLDNISIYNPDLYSSIKVTAFSTAGENLGVVASVAIKVLGLKVNENGYGDYTASVSNTVANSAYTYRWLGINRKTGDREELTVDPTSNRLVIPNPDRFAFITLELHAKTDDGTLGEYLEYSANKWMGDPSIKGLNRTSFNTFTATLQNNPAGSAYTFLWEGTLRSDGSVVVIPNVSNTSNVLHVDNPDIYSKIKVTLCENTLDGSVGEPFGNNKVVDVSIPKIALARTDFDTFTTSFTSTVYADAPYGYKWTGTLRSDGSAVDLSEFASGAVLSIVNADLYKSIGVELYAKDDENLFAGLTGIKKDLAIAGISLNLAHTLGTEFSASVGDALDDASYKYRWAAVNAKTRQEQALTAAIESSSISVDNIDEYSYIKVYLCDSDGNPLSLEAQYCTDVTLDITKSGSSYSAQIGGFFDENETYTIKWQAMYSSGSSKALTAAADGSVSPADAQNYDYLLAVLYGSDGEPVYDITGNPVTARYSLVSADAASYNMELQKVYIDGKLYYRAAVKSGDSVVMGLRDGSYVSKDGYAWLWEVTSDPSDHTSWEGTDRHFWKENEINAGMQDYQLAPYRNDRFYRVSWCQLLKDENGNYKYLTDADGRPILDSEGNRTIEYKVVLQNLIGPKKLVFVYDKARTDFGHSVLGVTTFDGYDKSDGSVFPDGDDANLGYDPYHAVKTIKRAYELLDDGVSMEDNMIIVMGFLYPDKGKFYWRYNETAEHGRPATITGNYGGIIYDGVINLISDNENSSSVSSVTLGAPTTFADITWCGFNNQNYDLREKQVPYSLHFYANMHDVTFGRGLKMINYDNIGSSLGIISGSYSPFITIIAGCHNYNSTVLPDRPLNSDPGFTTMNIYGGVFGRIISTSRNNGTYVQSVTNNIFGSPEKPMRVKVNIDIEHTGVKGDKDLYIPADHNPKNNYTYDIGLLVGGQTDGSVYTESEISLRKGYVGRYISGNISYGRKANDGFPSDSFYGSTTLNLYDADVYELYGGSLGRHNASTNGTDKCEGYFYGRSIINIYGGKVRNNIYGSGAGGVSGVGDDDFHTDDTHIPYYTADGTLLYGDYDAVKTGVGVSKVPTVQMADGTEISLVNTQSEVNIYSGVIEGNIYGAGYGYSPNISYDKASPLAGNLYGSAKVKIASNATVDPIIYGNIYGAGAGSSLYYTNSKKTLTPEEALATFGEVGSTFGDVNIEILAGEIYGDVYGGGAGVMEFKDMARLVGNTSVVVNGGQIYGNIYGGGALAAIRRHPQHTANPDASGNTSVEILNGTIGNNIFGGSQGAYSVSSGVVSSHSADIDGNTSVRIIGGSYIADPYTRDTKGAVTGKREFNIYGGGNINCAIAGNTNIYAEKSLFEDIASVLPAEENDNRPATYDSDFDAAFRDITFRRFCVYGGGYGEYTWVKGNANVHINVINGNAGGLIAPDGREIKSLIPGQTFFDVAGGGYSGDVGYWADANGVSVTDLESRTHEDFVTYVSGDVNVTVEGYPFIRKVIGGAFYASVSNANTHLISGNVHSIYGGGLMGYVHHKAKLTIGSRSEDDADASSNNKKLFVLTDVYGGNDVEGVIGTSKWIDDYYDEVSLESDGAPLFTADVDESHDVGVEMFVYGGNILGNIYGAGNGHYRGYYVPGWLNYSDGPARQYRSVYLKGDKKYTGLVYRSRPMVGIVKMHIAGNAATGDRVVVKGNVYGGGRSCTVGKWNTILPLEDPRRLAQGGVIRMNFGSHVTVEGNVYMGAQGKEYTTQSTVPENLDIDIQYFNGKTIHQLDRIGDLAYDHWYLDSNLKYYVPGFPKPGAVDVNFGMTGEHMLRGYLKNIEMNGDVELTFYNNPYDADGKRRDWVPSELAVSRYDATDVVITNLFAGGQCGSMTNNRLMKYCYLDDKPVDPDVYLNDDGTPKIAGHGDKDIEEYGGIYRISLMKGVKILDKVVGGSQDAITKIFGYKNNYKTVNRYDALGNEKTPNYVFEGGMVTQSGLGYDLIVYNDRHDEIRIGRDPHEYLMDESDPDYNQYTMKDGTVIYRYAYEENNPCLPDNSSLHRSRYHLAVTKDSPESTTVYGYAGTRETRPASDMTVIKMGINCEFEPRVDSSDPTNHAKHYGGLVYGGCYNSGVTIGDVVINVGSNLLGSHVTEAENLYGEMSSLAHNLGRVFGGGYGVDSRVDGDTYINLLRGFMGMNVFGGGCQGDVSGTANINYLGSETESFVYGSIYGGGLSGNVGTKDVTRYATHVNLYSGNVANVYGGSCMGNLYGQAKVFACDEIGGTVPYLDFTAIYGDKGTLEWSGSRLIAGSVYGGNDISGSIFTLPVDENSPADDKYSAIVHVTEVKADDNKQAGNESTGKDSPGSYEGYNGFPFIGNLYAGSNGNYGTHDQNDILYNGGVITFSAGDGNATYTVSLAGDKEAGYSAYRVPSMQDVLMRVNGGTILNAFGGGNMATVDGSTTIDINYNETNVKARAGFETKDELTRLYNVLQLTSKYQIKEAISEVAAGKGTNYVFNNHIYRLFGGNDNADMAIQPTWMLNRGYIGSVYSGGNFGRMTYFDYDENDNPIALSLLIASRDLRAESVYGGGRVGDIAPNVPSYLNPGDDFYGATLEIYDGVIDHVYGGNDVSGNVYHGAKVMIHGAISGDVYCAGNGDHLFYYDASLPGDTKIEERYSDEYGGRYFVLPRRDVYGGENPSDAHKILAINSYRPNVDRAYMMISGTAEAPAYVRGNVYCGGNSATVVSTGADGVAKDCDILFSIGDYSTLNGVYLGSNGENLTDGDMIHNTELINDIDLAAANTLTSADAQAFEADAVAISDVDATDHALYPNLLNLYMRAVEVEALPTDFNLSPDLVDAYIGDFFVGGNNGSMITNKTISLTFPESVVIYGKIVGGSNSANLTYKSLTHVGGLTRDVVVDEDNPSSEKVHLTVKSRFEPWRLVYPVEEDDRKIELVADIENSVDNDGKLYFPSGKCSVYGGCFNSGLTVGGIGIDVYSDMVGEYDYTSADPQSIGYHLAALGLGHGNLNKKRVIVDGMADLTRRSFAVVGGGSGANTMVHGDIRVRMLPGKVHPAYAEGVSAESPSVSSLFGGSELGGIIGNTTVEVRDGLVLTNTYGASEAAPMYGSTQTIIGWPDYYVCNTAKVYKLDRADNISRAAEGEWKNSDDNRPAVMEEIPLRPGDIISRSLYRLINNKSAGDFTYVDDDQPHNFKAKNTDLEYNDITWDDIDIKIGYNKLDEDTPDFYGYGNVYGGGFVSSSSSVSLAGQYTVRRFTETKTPDAALVGYGGNSTVLVWDNKENADLTRAIGGDAGSGAGTNGASIRDHVSIGTGRYVPVTLKAGQDLIGKYIYDDATGHYIHQSAHTLTAGDPLLSNTYYKIESDGGIYGGGRQVFVEGFRDCDVAYYGYADYSPQFPKLLNTFQRLDLLTVTDCCLQLQGATDFTVNKLNGTQYSLTRIGELSMVSSLDPTKDLDPGVRETTGLFNILHNEARTRNYVAFFNNVHYVAAVTSSEDFENPYRGANGALYSKGDFDNGQATDNMDEISDMEGYEYTPIPDADFSYKRYKELRINNYYANSGLETTDNAGNELIDNQNAKMRTTIEFDQRNIGTAANMIGINNGYVLNVQGAVIDEGGQDKIYYGPVHGVFEVKLLTLALNEGGGYVFALNQHDDPNHFLETTGNFVFPGAAYMVSQDAKHRYNYIYDDCFPMGRGWEHYYDWNGKSSAMGPRNSMSRASDVPVDPGHGDCNELQEVHYWYVNGTDFYYNVTLTAYTYNEGADFTLNNDGELIYLYGVDPGTNLKVNKVTWAPSNNVDSDLQNMDKDYSFYISLDKNPTQIHTTSVNSGNAFVSPVPRADFDVANPGGCSDTSALPSNAVNNYSDYSDGTLNNPLVGISLIDNVNNSTREYYDEHLREPEEVIIEMVANEGEVSFRYVITLTVKYLLGPTISGLPEIENCALPGEYIFANAFNVVVDLDDEGMAVTKRNWYAVSDQYDLSTTSGVRDVIAGIGSSDPEKRTIGFNLEDEVFDGDMQVHIPAYMHIDGWHLIHEVVANGMSFFLHPDATLPIDEGFVPRRKFLDVHNYHRMRPYDGTSVNPDGTPKYEDLQIVAGANIYIEDDADMEYFFQWLRECQQPSGRFAPDGRAINPQYADSLNVYLMADVKMPAIATASTSAVDGLVFRGTFHGNGHNIDMGKNRMFIGQNRGMFYNTGFVSTLTGDHAYVFGKNLNRYDDDSKLVGGKIENCFLYNAANIAYGRMDNNLSGDRGTIVNSFRTSDSSQTNINDGLAVASLDDFEYGEVAYNLNRFYLRSRYDRGIGVDDDEFVDPLLDIYHDGDYRYARYSDDGEATALRTAQIPNYHNFKGLRSGVTAANYVSGAGCEATFHNTDDLIDETRAVRDTDGEIITDEYGYATYKPNFPDDYLFFGQDLTYNSDEAAYPHSINATNRVYRASGFYGSKIDRGFHFNLDAQAVQSTLTAVDFTGYRDAEHGNTYGVERVNYADQSCYYPPMLDMPARMMGLPDGGVRSFTTSTREMAVNPSANHTDLVTRNLLIYTRPSDPVFDDFEYDADTAEGDIFGHLINPTLLATGTPDIDEVPTRALFHLVDREDFNCPIAFNVTENTWYERIPETFSTGNNAWDGICLPFTVQLVRAEISDPDENSVRNHGELTHFYGPHKGVDIEAESHEYWLRKFTAADSKGLNFDRPASEDDIAANNPAEDTRDYFYSNDYFSKAFGQYYGDGTSHARPQYTPEGLTYVDYPMITHEMPYIISFPGERYYEFDLSGNFYASKFVDARAVPQRIVFSTPGDNLIKVTDNVAIKQLTHDGYAVTGTYMHHTVADGYTAAISGDLSDCFQRQALGAMVDPFRVYVNMPESHGKPMPIVSRAIDSIGDDTGDQDADRDLEYYVDGDVLYINSPYEESITLPLFDIEGRLIRYLEVNEGENSYTGIAPGYYIVNQFKFRI